MMIRVSAYSLRTDSWQDCMAFLADARDAQTAGNHRNANRFLRAAMLALFAHVDGVLDHICTAKGISPKGPLCEKRNRVEMEARKIDKEIESLNVRFEKELRNIIAHGGLVKEYEDEHGHRIRLSEASVYEQLSVRSLERIVAILNPWLDRVCQVLAVERFVDTETLCRKWSEIAGGCQPFDVNEI